MKLRQYVCVCVWFFIAAGICFSDGLVLSRVADDPLPPHPDFPLPKQKKENRPRIGVLPAHYYAETVVEENEIVYDNHTAGTVADFFLSIIDELAGEGDTSLVVVLGSLVRGDTGKETELSQYLEHHLSYAITRSEKFLLFARDQLEEILALQELGLSDLFKEGTGPGIGDLHQVDGLITGYFFEQGDEVLIFLTLIDIDTGIHGGSVSLRINRELIL